MVKNADVIGTLVACDQRATTAFSTSTKNVIVSLDQGDIVFVRTSTDYGGVSGTLATNKAMRASFSGFLLN